VLGNRALHIDIYLLTCLPLQVHRCCIKSTTYIINGHWSVHDSP